jgi:hypothetical protein
MQSGKVTGFAKARPIPYCAFAPDHAAKVVVSNLRTIKANFDKPFSLGSPQCNVGQGLPIIQIAALTDAFGQASAFAGNFFGERSS